MSLRKIHRAYLCALLAVLAVGLTLMAVERYCERIAWERDRVADAPAALWWRPADGFGEGDNLYGTIRLAPNGPAVRCAEWLEEPHANLTLYFAVRGKECGCSCLGLEERYEPTGRAVDNRDGHWREMRRRQ
jgi:hypothetical protein